MTLVLLLLLGIVFMAGGAFTGAVSGGKSVTNEIKLGCVLSFITSFLLLFTDALPSLVGTDAADGTTFSRLVGFAGYLCWCWACLLLGDISAKWLFGK